MLPDGFGQGGRKDDFLNLVEQARDLAILRGPEGGKALVGFAPEQQRVGPTQKFNRIVFPLLIGVVSVDLLQTLAWPIKEAIERHHHQQNNLPHAVSPSFGQAR